MENLNWVYRYYHWLVAASAAIVLLGQGVTFFTVGLYLDPITETHGFTKSQFGFTMSVLSLSTAIGSLISPWFRGQLGFKATMLLGCGMSAVAMFGLSLAGEIHHFHIAAAFIGIGAGLCSLIPASTLVTNWFVKRRGLVMATVLSATAFGGSLFSPVAAYLIDTHTYHVALQASALVIALTLIPVLVIVKEKPSELGLLPFGGPSDDRDSAQKTHSAAGLSLNEARRTPSFYMLVFGNTVYVVCFGATMYYVPSMLGDAGVSQLAVGAVMSATFVAVSAGKFLMGAANDRFGIHACMAYGTSLLIAAMILSNFVSVVWLAYLFAVIYGLSVALATLPQTLLTAKIFGDKDFAAIFSIVSGVALFASAVATYIGGVARDLLGSYSLLFGTTGAFSAIAFVCVLFALRHKPTFATMEEVNEH